MSDIEDIKEYKINLTQKQSIELLKNTLNKFEIRGEQLHLLKIAIKNVLSEREQDKKRIKELEEENKLLLNSKVGIDLSYDDYIPKQKVKGLLTEIQKEYEKLDKASDEFLSNEKKTVEDYILEKERLATMQTLAYCRDNLEELLEEK